VLEEAGKARGTKLADHVKDMVEKLDDSARNQSSALRVGALEYLVERCRALEKLGELANVVGAAMAAPVPCFVLNAARKLVNHNREFHNLVASAAQQATQGEERVATESFVARPIERPSISTSPSIGEEADPKRAKLIAAIRRTAEEEGVPPDLAEAVAFVESRFSTSAVGSVGEVGLMQIRFTTAQQMGFLGGIEELFDADENIHYSVKYLAGGWRLTGGDFCMTLVKYRAGWGETAITQRSIWYCHEAYKYLKSRGSNLVDNVVLPEAPSGYVASAAGYFASAPLGGVRHVAGARRGGVPRRAMGGAGCASCRIARHAGLPRSSRHLDSQSWPDRAAGAVGSGEAWARPQAWRGGPFEYREAGRDGGLHGTPRHVENRARPALRQSLGLERAFALERDPFRDR
jgi:soluble lytic murein transglycosylase-like protein